MNKEKALQIAEESVRLMKENPSWTIQKAFEEAKKIYGVKKA